MSCAVHTEHNSNTHQALRSYHPHLEPAFLRVGNNRRNSPFRKGDMRDRLFRSEQVFAQLKRDGFEMRLHERKIVWQQGCEQTITKGRLLS
jgi:hypothetical protein